jgi:hypothetical protein
MRLEIYCIIWWGSEHFTESAAIRGYVMLWLSLPLNIKWVEPEVVWVQSRDSLKNCICCKGKLFSLSLLHVRYVHLAVRIQLERTLVMSHKMNWMTVSSLLVGWDWVHLVLRPLPALGDRWWWLWSNWQGNWSTRRKLPAQLFWPQIWHEETQTRTQTNRLSHWLTQVWLTDAYLRRWRILLICLELEKYFVWL